MMYNLLYNISIKRHYTSRGDEAHVQVPAQVRRKYRVRRERLPTLGSRKVEWLRVPNWPGVVRRRSRSACAREGTKRHKRRVRRRQLPALGSCEVEWLPMCSWSGVVRRQGRGVEAR